MEVQKTGFKTSSNFWINLITMISAIFGVVILADDNPFPFGEAVSVYEAIISKSIVAIVVAAFTFGNSIRNIIKNYDFGKWKAVFTSKNVWTAVITTVTAGLAYFNITFPQDEAMGVLEALKSGNIELILIAIFNFGNMLWHIIKKPKPAGMT